MTRPDPTRHSGKTRSQEETTHEETCNRIRRHRGHHRLCRHRKGDAQFSEALVDLSHVDLLSEGVNPREWLADWPLGPAESSAPMLAWHGRVLVVQDRGGDP